MDLGADAVQRAPTAPGRAHCEVIWSGLSPFRSMFHRTALTVLALASVHVVAQNVCPDGGLGSPVAQFELDSATGNNGHLGLERLGTEFFVSSRGPGAIPPHRTYVFDGSGSLLRSFDQPAATSSSFWGLRDLTHDGVNLFGGDEVDIYGFDAQGSTVTQIVAANGPTTFGPFTNSPAHVLVGTFRGLAFDRDGNGGAGSFWVASYGSPIVEMSLSGAVLRQFANSSNWTIYGLALDPVANSLWIYAQPGAGDVVEISRVTGVPTGRVIPAVGIEGGLTIWTEGLRTMIARLDQSGPDVVHVASLRAVHTIGDGLELQTKVDSGPFDRSFKAVALGAQNLNLRVVGGPTNAATACFVNLGTDASICASLSSYGSAFDSLADFTAAISGSVPQGLAIDFPMVVGSTVTFPAAVLPQFGPIRMQAIWIDSRVPAGYLPIVATNEAELDVDLRPPLGVIAQANGINSFNAVTTSGFFSVLNPTGTAITKLTITAVGGMFFDPAQSGMADRFDAGNGTATGCLGTYRNGSAVAAGLDFSVTPVTPCDPLARQGFVLQANGTELVFEFTGGLFANGVKFEWDCDTDFGAGINGAAMAGMRVVIDLANNDRRTGVLVADPGGAQKSTATL